MGDFFAPPFLPFSFSFFRMSVAKAKGSSSLMLTTWLCCVLVLLGRDTWTKSEESELFDWFSSAARTDVELAEVVVVVVAGAVLDSVRFKFRLMKLSSNP